MEADFGYLGCENDVMFLADKWCSGRLNCDISLPNQDLDDANQECNVRGLNSYMEIEYDCVASMYALLIHLAHTISEIVI